MRKLLYLFSLLLPTCYGMAQQKVTSITQITSDGDTSRTLYVSNAAGDSLIVDKSTIYHLSVSNKGVNLIVNDDTLVVEFQDADKKVLINKDIYSLFPAFYSQFKQTVLVKHSVLAVLELLEDCIGDYPIETALPLLLFSPQTAKRIRSANIITRRSQADMSDWWKCVYHYNKNGKLSAVTAASAEETRFSKKVSYNGARIMNIKTYRSLESRQVTDRTIFYARYPLLKWQEHVLETGKNRESELTVTLKRSMQ
jgi:hypothetical protein